MSTFGEKMATRMEMYASSPEERERKRESLTFFHLFFETEGGRDSLVPTRESPTLCNEPLAVKEMK